MNNKSKPKYKLILDAAVEVIAENGYHHSQVSKIANIAGVADGTIYLYFKNKEDILISLFQEKMGQFIGKIEEEIAQTDQADEKLFRLIEMHFRQLSEDPLLAVVTQLELRQSNKRLRLQINEVLKRYLIVIDDILKEGMEDGTFQSQLNVKLVRQVIFGTLDEVVTNWVMKDQRYDLIEQAKEVHHLIYNGLRNHS
ncbi:TetR/AcrR family transcriptional regulator [Halalkalibacillus halophilus]|uniref:TetR/AcrR family transcriptional regulator n=1 Tax=Halalkalibacillus halophilus TaxID=392827 RepID=UPI00041AFF77|nr:TetR/AcrR family transcriptional regulator [Halalkalibacillus halophilus]